VDLTGFYRKMLDATEGAGDEDADAPRIVPGQAVKAKVAVGATAVDASSAASPPAPAAAAAMSSSSSASSSSTSASTSRTIAEATTAGAAAVAGATSSTPSAAAAAAESASAAAPKASKLYTEDDVRGFAATAVVPVEVERRESVLQQLAKKPLADAEAAKQRFLERMAAKRRQ
jgi:hypothetical protein